MSPALRSFTAAVGRTACSRLVSRCTFPGPTPPHSLAPFRSLTSHAPRSGWSSPSPLAQLRATDGRFPISPIRRLPLTARKLHAETLKPEKLSPNQHRLIFLVILTGTLVIGGDIIYFTFYHEPVAATLTPEDFRRFKLAEVFPVTHDTSLFRFAANLPQADSPAGFPVPSHVVVKDHTCQVARSYTPVTYARGHFDLLVKKYENGSVSRFLHDTPVGEFIEMRGPIVTLPYEANSVADIGMIAGGTGITPMYQLIKRILRDPDDETRVTLLFANRTAADILLYNELQILAAAKPDRLRVVYTVDSASGAKDMPENTAAAPKPLSVGLIDKAIIAKHMPPPELGREAAILVCGPDGFIRHISGAKPNDVDQGPLGGLLKELGYEARQVFKF
ncbi:hypothetical protein HDU86_008381 [Geranomyces michiganensis]|nr:hypothetical protein HDU86_008381 [Geranomyces michiganensis]